MSSNKPLVNPTPNGPAGQVKPVVVAPRPVAPTPVARPISTTVIKSAHKSSDSICIYGATDTKKTTQIGRVAKYYYEEFGLKTRLISIDLGLWTPLQKYVDAGIIEPFNLHASPNPLSTLLLIAGGAWPEVQGDNRVLTKRDWREEKIGVVALDSLTSLALTAKADIVDKGRPTGNETDKTSFVEDGLNFGLGGRGAYNVVQDYMRKAIIELKSLPVELQIFTAADFIKEDEKSHKMILGPALSGQAMLATFPGMVGDLLHAQTIAEVGKPIEVRYYFYRHPDIDFRTAIWPAKPRINEEDGPKLEKMFDGKSYFSVKHNDFSTGLETYIKAKKRLEIESAEEARKRREEVDAKRREGDSNK